jgi:hypothetical protein
MEGKRDEESGNVRKTRLFVYSEDFVEFFRLIKSAAEFIKQNPLPNKVREKREQFWAKQSDSGASGVGVDPRRRQARAPGPQGGGPGAVLRGQGSSASAAGGISRT